MIKLLSGATATNSPPSGDTAGFSLHERAIAEKIAPADLRSATLLIKSTAGSGTMTGTFKIWGYSRAAQTKATGTITPAVQASMTDGETFVLSHNFAGTITAYTFEFDKTGDGVTAGNESVDISGASSVADITAIMTTAINASEVRITATDGTTTTNVTADDYGPDQNISITEDMANGSATGMSGGALGAWFPLGTNSTAASKGLLNEGNAIGETSADAIVHAEIINNLHHFDRVYLEVTAIGGTATAFDAWLIGRGG